MIPDEFLTIRNEVENEYREKSSRFLAVAFPVFSRDEAEERLAAIRKKYHDATHHCFAYTVFEKDTVERSSDDGEPSGTAGKPILRAIGKSGYHNVCVVVVRWFGGVKLGTGGLTRAYGEAASGALHLAEKHRCDALFVLDIRFPHEATNGVMRTLAQFGATMRSSTFEENAAITILLHGGEIPRFTASMTEATRGAARISVGDEQIILR